MVSPFSGWGEMIAENKRRKAEGQSKTLDELTKMAALKESGYDVVNRGGKFGLVQNPQFGQVPEGFVRVGGKVMQDPSYVNEKDRADIEYKKSKAGKDSMLTPGQLLAKDKATKEIFEKYEMNKARKATLDKAAEGADTLPQGWFGKTRIGLAQSQPWTKKLFGVTDQNIVDAQEMKMALTMGTLAETAYTKGAISDQEMNLFKAASANNDFNSPAIRPVLEKIARFTEAENSGLFGAYKQNYGEDPKEWFGSGASNVPSFNTPEEAEASGVKGEVMIAGRRARIE